MTLCEADGCTPPCCHNCHARATDSNQSCTNAGAIFGIGLLYYFYDKRSAKQTSNLQKLIDQKMARIEVKKKRRQSICEEPPGTQRGIDQRVTLHEQPSVPQSGGKGKPSKGRQMLGSGAQFGTEALVGGDWRWYALPSTCAQRRGAKLDPRTHHWSRCLPPADTRRRTCCAPKRVRCAPPIQAVICIDTLAGGEQTLARVRAPATT